MQSFASRSSLDKKKSNEELFDAAMDAINASFTDDSVSKEETANGLRDLIGEIETMIDSLKDAGEDA